MSKIVNCGQKKGIYEKKFIDYLKPLLFVLKQKQVKENTISLFQRVIREKTMQIWRLSDNKREYDNFHNLVNGYEDILHLTLLF